MIPLTAPFPYPGGKRRAAELVWQALGRVRVYVEPFFGSGAVLLARPDEPAIETVNDRDGLLCNVWRSLQLAPAETARHANYPVSEIDLHARHRELVRRAEEVRAKLEADPRWCDPELAGWWVWGASQWIGGGWCAIRERQRLQRPAVCGTQEGKGVHALRPPRRLPNITTAGAGSQRSSMLTTWLSRPFVSARGSRGVQRQLPTVRADGGSGVARVTETPIGAWFEALSARLRRVRVVCGDFARVLTPSVIYPTSGLTGVFLDPPYAHSLRAGELYAHDDAEASTRAREWALEHGDDPRLRIVLAGLDGEHEMPAVWRCIPWLGAAGLGRRSGNRHKERLWLSPHCERQRDLFDIPPGRTA